MANASTYIIRFAGWLAKSIGDSAGLFADFRGELMGLELPPAVTGGADVQSALRGAETTATRVGAAGVKLEAAAGSGDDLKILAGFLELGVALAEFYAALDNLVSKVQANVNAGTVPDAVARAAAANLAGELAKRMSDVILGSAITNQAPQIALVLRLLGLLDWRRIPVDPANPLSRQYILRKLELNRFKTLISDPAEHYRQALQWGDAGFDPADIFALYRGFFNEEVDIEIGVEGGQPFLRQGQFKIIRNPATVPPSLTLSFEASVTAREETRRAIDENWGVGSSVTMSVSAKVTGSLKPVLEFSLQPVTGQMTGEVRGFINRNPEKRPFDLLGGVGLLELSVEDVKAGIGARAATDGAAFTFEPLLFADISKATLKIGSSDADSFIGQLLASAEIEGEVNLGVEWAPSEGLRVKASGGVEIALPIHRAIGPVTFETLYLVLTIRTDGTLSFEVSAAILGQLGPLSASVDRIGAQLDLRFADDADADFGPFDVGLKFKPPNGIGLAIDAGVVKGGGYIYLDFEKGEYAGALELTFSGFLSLKAIGLINTKLPGGKPGFSLLIIITAEFMPGFQLGFGFVLAGVGGLLGLHRAVVLEALAQGVRTGAANNILFPTNVIQNAPRIISDLKVIFPPEEGTFLIGPMAKIGWGTPVLVSLSLGIIIEIPGNIVILGRLRVNLPTEETALILLQVTFIGAIEFDKKRIWFFASLFESRVLFITIDGEMGLLMDFSENPNFILSVGGFHPRYKVPALPFPSPKRISISLINESFARVRAEAYFAVTSNSVQFGSQTELYFGFDSLSVEGHFGFDALIQFSPLHFLVEMSAGFSVKVFGLGLFGVRLNGSLEGPAPWRVRGEATISLLFFDVSVDVDVTFGDRNNDTLPSIDVMPLIRAEIEKPENWVTGLPPSGQFMTSLRQLGDAGKLVLHPVGTLKISQRTAPLKLKIDKVGNRTAADANEVSLEISAPGLEAAGGSRESFARAQYQNMDDAKKLSQPAFELLEGGVELAAAGGQQWASGVAADRHVRYETIIIDTHFERFRIRFFEFWGGLFTHFLKGSAVARSSLSLATENRKQPFADKVELAGDRYAVAFSSTNQVYTGTTVFHTQAEAAHHLGTMLSATPELAEEIHVIPAAEINQG